MFSLFRFYANHLNLFYRQVIWDQESANITKTAEALMESASNKNDDIFITAKHMDHVRPMFKLAWSPCLAAFSIGLQDCDDSNIANLCLEGIQCSIRISCIFCLTLERNAFVQALARFTLLTDNSNSAEIKTKNVGAIKALISVAFSDGNHLETSWLDVMKCISQLEAAQNNVSGLKNLNNNHAIIDGHSEETSGQFGFISIWHGNRDHATYSKRGRLQPLQPL